MTKEQARGMAARIAGVVLTIFCSGFAGWTAVVIAAEKRVAQIATNTRADAEIRATHKEDKKDAAAAIEKVRDRIGDMRAEQAATTTQVESNAAILAEVRSDIKTLLSRRD